MIIVIDGPAGSGKSSTARAVAGKLRLQYLDSGALYRVAALVYLQCDCSRALFLERLKESKISFNFKDNNFFVSLDENSVTEKIREPGVSETVSRVAAMPEVRSFVNEIMNRAVADGVYIADGRDLGTAVFPDAALKFYMVADLDERAARRFSELKDAGITTTFETVKANLEARDKIDAGRKTDPLKKADDAILINTSGLTFEEQVLLVSEKVRQVLAQEQN